MVPGRGTRTPASSRRLAMRSRRRRPSSSRSRSEPAAGSSANSAAIPNAPITAGAKSSPCPSDGRFRDVRPDESPRRILTPTTICSSALIPRMTATAAQTGARRNAQHPRGRSGRLRLDRRTRTNCHVIRIRTISTRIAAATSAICPARGPMTLDTNRMVMLLRSTIATGMQHATAKAATSAPTSRTASIGRAKKNRSRPSAIVMTAKHSSAPRPDDGKRPRQRLARPIDPRHRRDRLRRARHRAAQSCAEYAGAAQGRAGMLSVLQVETRNGSHSWGHRARS